MPTQLFLLFRFIFILNNLHLSMCGYEHFFQDRVSLCCPTTHTVDQVGLDLRDWPAFAS